MGGAPRHLTHLLLVVPDALLVSRERLLSAMHQSH